MHYIQDELCTLKEFLECLVLIAHTLHPPDSEEEEEKETISLV